MLKPSQDNIFWHFPLVTCPGHIGSEISISWKTLICLHNWPNYGMTYFPTSIFNIFRQLSNSESIKDTSSVRRQHETGHIFSFLAGSHPYYTYLKISERNISTGPQILHGSKQGGWVFPDAGRFTFTSLLILMIAVASSKHLYIFSVSAAI